MIDIKETLTTESKENTAMVHTNTSINGKRANALPPPPSEAICQVLSINTITIEWLAGDGSDRCYYRLRSPDLEHSMVLMQLSGSDAAALKCDGYDWIKLSNILVDQNIYTPKVIKSMPDYAALIIEDYGDVMLETTVSELLQKNLFQQIKIQYGYATQIISRFLKIPKDPKQVWCQRKFDSERFHWELHFFRQQYLEGVLGIHLEGSQLQEFGRDSIALAKFLGERSEVFTHRDFHSRNLMSLPDKLAVIDFQDARIGPAAYDLVSIIFDSYVSFSTEQRTKLLENSLEIIQRKCGEPMVEEIRVQLLPMLLERQLKAIGSFGYLTNEKKRGEYLHYVMPANQILLDFQVKDPRWPFISGAMLEMIKKNHPLRVTSQA